MHLEYSHSQLHGALAEAIAAGRACVPEVGDLSQLLPYGFRPVIDRVRQALQADDVLNPLLGADLAQLGDALTERIANETRWVPPDWDHVDAEALPHLLKPVRTSYGERLLAHSGRLVHLRALVESAQAHHAALRVVSGKASKPL